MGAASFIISRVTQRPPDFQIGGADDPYLNRWWVIPRNRFFNVYLHQFIRDDDDRALHDHPLWSLSWLMRGQLIETTKHPKVGFIKRLIVDGDWRFRSATFAHRLELPDFARHKTWTLFITGPRLREWGFHCSKGWVHWRDFTAGDSGEIVGRGCGE